MDQGLTRRTLIAGGAAGAAALSLPSTLVPSAAAGTSMLGRSEWLSQLGRSVTCEGCPDLTVLSVDDLSFAHERGLGGSEDAFSVLLGAPSSAPAITGLARIRLRDPDRAATLFLAPVDRTGDVARYELVVDRSVRLATADPPEPTAPPVIGESPVADPQLTPAESAEVRRYAFLRSARLGRRRGRRVVKLRFRDGAEIERVSVRLERAGRVLARGRDLAVEGGAEVGLRMRAPLPRGRYDLVVTAIDANGRRTAVRRLVAV